MGGLASVVAEQREGQREKHWIHRKIGCECEREHGCEGEAMDGFGDGVENGAGCEDAGWSSYACRNCEWVEEKSIFLKVISTFENVLTIRRAYPAPIAMLLHLLSLRGDVYSFEDTASPDSAIFMRALALNRSMMIYNAYVNVGYESESGSSEKSGRRRGAWWYTPPS